MIVHIAGYYEYNDCKSVFKKLPVLIRAHRMEKLRDDLKQATGHEIMFYYTLKPYARKSSIHQS